MLYDGKIMLGAGYDGPDYLVPEMAVRHGLISGATPYHALQPTAKSVVFRL